MTYLKNTVTLQFNAALCTGCGMCTKVCPHGVFEIRDKKAGLQNRDRCMECGACMMNCPEGAIQVEKGVGCAYAVIASKLKGRTEISCDCGGEDTPSADCADSEPSSGCCGGGSSGCC